MQIVNDQGRVFNVKVIRKGDRYGLNCCLTYDETDRFFKENDCLVEFYDATFADKNGFGPLGQFVNRCYLSTLTDNRSGQTPNGIILEGSQAKIWNISAKNKQQAIEFANGSN